jgi:hypothetical protein
MTVADCWKGHNFGILQYNNTTNNKIYTICEFADILAYELLYNSFSDNPQDCRMCMSPLRRSPRQRKNVEEDEDDNTLNDDGDGDGQSSTKKNPKISISYGSAGTNEMNELSSMTADGSRVKQEMLWSYFRNIHKLEKETITTENGRKRRCICRECGRQASWICNYCNIHYCPDNQGKEMSNATVNTFLKHFLTVDYCWIMRKNSAIIIINKIN